MFLVERGQKSAALASSQSIPVQSGRHPLTCRPPALLDQHQVLHYSSKKLSRKFLCLGLLCLGLGALLAWLDPPSTDPARP